jgi:Protein of unknown function (DUF2690)
VNTRKWLATVLSPLVIAGGLIVFDPVASGAATAPCRTGVSCGYAGQDPVTTGCSIGAYPVDNARQLIDTGPTGNLNLMYSLTCHTNWVEADGLIYVGRITVWNEVGNQASRDNIPNDGGWGYTPMVNGAYDAGGCIANDRFFYCVGQPNIPSGDYPRYNSF